MAGCSTNNTNEKKDDSLYLPIINTKIHKLGYINAKDGKIAIEPQFALSDNTMCFDTYHNRYAIIWEDSYWKIIDNQGKVTFDTSKQNKDYALVSYFFDSYGNVYAVDKDNKHVKINGEGNVESSVYYPCVDLYDINDQNPQLICFSKENDDNYYALDDQQNVIFKSKYPFIFNGNKDVYDENIGVCYIDTGKGGSDFDRYDYYFIDNKGNKLFDGRVFDGADSFTKKGYAYISNADISFLKDNEDDIIYTSRSGEIKLSIIDENGKEVYVLKEQEKACFSDKDFYIDYLEEAKHGIKDSKGKVVIEAQFDDIVIHENCFIAHDKNNKKYDLYSIDGKVIKSLKDVDSLEVINKYMIVNNQYIYDFKGNEIVNVKKVDKNLQISLSKTQLTRNGE